MGEEKFDPTELALEEKGEGKKDILLTLSTGVVCRVQPIPLDVWLDTLSRIEAKRPKVPVHFYKDRGVEAENPNHPDYIDRVKSFENLQAQALIYAMVNYGVEVVETPKKFSKAEDNDWFDRYLALDENAEKYRDNAHWRKLKWFLREAAPLPSDTELIMKEIKRLMGVPEEDVADAAQFPES